MKPRSAKAKGKLLEQFIVDRLQETGLDPRAYPQRGSGSGKNKGDIWNSLGLHFEAKNQKAIHWKVWKDQLDDENVSHLPTVLVWHPPRDSIENSVVILDWHFFEELLIKVFDKKEKPTFMPRNDMKKPESKQKTTGFSQCIHKSKLCGLCHLKPKKNLSSKK